MAGSPAAHAPAAAGRRSCPECAAAEGVPAGPQPGAEGPPDPEPVPGDPREAEPTTRSSGLTPPDPEPVPVYPPDAELATIPWEPTPPDPRPAPGDPQDADSAPRMSGLTLLDPHPAPEDPPGPGPPRAADLSPEGVPPEPAARPREARLSRFSPAPGPCTGQRLHHAVVRQRSRSARVAAGPPESLAAQPGSAFQVRRSLRGHGEEAADRRSHLPCGHPPGARAPKRTRAWTAEHTLLGQFNRNRSLSWANYPRCRIAREAAAIDVITGGHS